MKKYVPISTLNAWRVLISNKPYIITPAHNVIYKKNNVWKKSEFVQNSNHKWKFHKSYYQKQTPEYDLAWVESTDSEQHLLPLICDIDIKKVDFYFLQPRDHTGIMTDDYQLGSISGTIYKSPNSVLYEALNIGFRGMSGAICSNNKKNFIGMFVRLGSNLGSDPNASTLQINETKEIKRGLIMSALTIESIISDKSNHILIDSVQYTIKNNLK
jgi:hypothetical protein